MPLQPFHLAIPVDDLIAAERFYGNLLGCSAGRRTEHWIDFNFYGHQLVCHQARSVTAATPPVNLVDGEHVPVPHFGVVLTWADWQELAQRLRDHETKFIIEPTIRFVGRAGEQATLFCADPAGNMLEFKAFRDPQQLFAI
jgi:extradiol dioxygenase family protein